MEFVEFNKIARLSRNCVITEKIDGTNGQIAITDDLQMFVGSRNRWLQPGADNFGFLAWAIEHRDELLTLGPGRHFGEWWGRGIQRGYDQTQKIFSLFNTIRWCEFGQEPQLIPSGNPKTEPKYQQVLPACCRLVPVIYRGPFVTDVCEFALAHLEHYGSSAAPGFRDPEGIVIYHTASGVCFKKTLKNDESPKSKV